MTLQEARDMQLKQAAEEEARRTAANTDPRSCGDVIENLRDAIEAVRKTGCGFGLAITKCKAELSVSRFRGHNHGGTWNIVNIELWSDE